VTKHKKLQRHSTTKIKNGPAHDFFIHGPL
ncbi:uncharacterized protein METZ01_LOCUS339553, partial [marine metagenome]